MLNVYNILETIRMIQDECLDIRTITMGISLLDCADTDIDKSCEKVYNKICTKAKDLVKVGEQIEKEYGIPIVNKRISVTPMALVAAASAMQSSRSLIPRSSVRMKAISSSRMTFSMSFC